MKNWAKIYYIKKWHCYYYVVLLALLQWLNFEQRVNEDIYWLLVFHERKALSYESLEIIFTFSMFPSWIIYSSHWDSNWRLIAYLHYIFTISLAGIMAFHLPFRVHSGVQVSKCLHINCSYKNLHSVANSLTCCSEKVCSKWIFFTSFFFFLYHTLILCLMERKNK